jgi:hypothetical protein
MVARPRPTVRALLDDTIAASRERARVFEDQQALTRAAR